MMNEQETSILEAVWGTLLSTSLKQTLILSYLNKKFPGSIQEMEDEFSVISKILAIQPDVEEDIAKTLSGLPKTSLVNNPFRIISNEIMTDTVIQTLMLRYFIRTNPGMASDMLEDFQLILAELDLNPAVTERVTTSLREFIT